LCRVSASNGRCKPYERPNGGIDDGVFSKPWSVAISYRRPLGEWPEMVCSENPQGHFPETHAAVPTADKPDF